MTSEHGSSNQNIASTATATIAFPEKRTAARQTAKTGPRVTTRATHHSTPRALGAMTASKATVARHTVTFEGVDAPSQRAPAPRFGDSTGARPSSSASLAEKQTVARDDHHVEGAFRGARVAPRLLGGWNGARREEHPGAESPRPKSRAEPRSPVTAARRRVVAAEVKLGVERMSSRTNSATWRRSSRERTIRRANARERRSRSRARPSRT